MWADTDERFLKWPIVLERRVDISLKKEEIGILFIQQVEQIKLISILKFSLLSSRKGSPYKYRTNGDCSQFLKPTASLSHFL
jgi:hypothetical protein